MSGEFSYRVIYSRRRSLQILVSDAQVTIRSPWGVSADTIASFVKEKEAWIGQKLAQQSERLNDDSLSPEPLDGAQLPWLGECLTLRLDSKGTQVSVNFSEKTLTMPLLNRAERRARLAKFYQRQACRYLKLRLDAWAEKTGIEYSKFAITSAKTRWGSCSQDGTIRLNWRLIALEPELIDYVIVHELAHRRHFNHSGEFWALVDRFYEKRKTAQVALRGLSCQPILY